MGRCCGGNSRFGIDSNSSGKDFCVFVVLGGGRGGAGLLLIASGGGTDGNTFVGNGSDGREVTGVDPIGFDETDDFLLSSGEEEL